MAASFGGSGQDEVVSEINVTPLVDVVLVLLVIFMITAPTLYHSSIQVQLPGAKSGDQVAASPITLNLTETGDLYWNKEALTWDAFKAKLQSSVEELKAQSAQGIIIGADQKTPHGTVIKLMDELRQVGLTRFAIQVDDRR